MVVGGLGVGGMLFLVRCNQCDV
ncbi:hypothetical protein KO481_28130 [Nocardia sp. NEAU-G5]|uniref:Uncharacterized protein n=1 Tax=Nocardia albiluteola TaxID=2842303 RepID=A0ABS6B891_9NOCA|nr:hypothetical protein [Nocardia albiluteola]